MVAIMPKSIFLDKVDLMRGKAGVREQDVISASPCAIMYQAS